MQIGMKEMLGRGFVNLPSLLYHPYLVCIHFGMTSPTSFYIFNVFYKSCKHSNEPVATKLSLIMSCTSSKHSNEPVATTLFQHVTTLCACHGRSPSIGPIWQRQASLV